jgi:hypothetical protein
MTQNASRIVHQLEQDVQALRIKKLLLYACKDCWESDSTRLHEISLDSLVLETLQNYPTPEHLKSRLSHLVGTLNKSAEYLQIATLITSTLTPLYENAAPEITLIRTPKAEPHPIAQILEQDLNLSRIKKLLICVCHKYWEANPYVIEQIRLSELLEELVKQYPTITALSEGLASTVRTLNKPIEYALVAETILQAIKPLYSQPVEPKPAAKAELPQPIELFDIRLEMMKYANPLRAKILLFSLAYYRFEFRSQDWSNLKLYSLDGLLRTVLSQSILVDELHQKLRQVAEQLTESEAYLEAANAIVKALKPNYTSLQQQLQQALQSSSVADVTCANATQLRSSAPDPVRIASESLGIAPV